MSTSAELANLLEIGDRAAFLRALFDQAVAYASPANCVPQYLPAPPPGRTLVIAAGKAAASMAAAVERHWPSNAPLCGIALTRYGHGWPCAKIKVIEASHPVPDDRGEAAAGQIMEAVAALGAEDLLLFLVSGGGSALMAMPAPGIELAEKKHINRKLLASGAPIGEMNIVRKHLSAVKGGRLARLAVPAKLVTLAISDVPGDDLSTIASGPTAPDTSSNGDAIALLGHYNIAVSDAVRAHLAAPANETPKPGDPAFAGSQFIMVSRPAYMVQHVGQLVADLGINLHNLGADIEGEARDVAREHAALALDLATRPGPSLILSGGETTVRVEDSAKTGRGGRNCEYLLALALALDGHDRIHAIAADTDGIDGSEDNAGAIISPNTLARAEEFGLDPAQLLARHDSYGFFYQLGELVMTGPTRTNVNDFRAILVSGQK